MELIQHLCKVNEQTKDPAFERAAKEVVDIINNRRGLEAAIALLNSTSSSNRSSCIPSSPSSSWSTRSEVERNHLIFEPSPDLDSPTTLCSTDLGSWKEGKRGIKSTLFKTEMCRNWRESQTCPYGRKCQFAHGDEELRQVARPPRYKTKPCREYHDKGLCNYGQRCHFLHKSASEQSEQDTESLLGDAANGVGASWLESGSVFPCQFEICGKENYLSQVLTGRHLEGDTCFHEFGLPSSSMGLLGSAINAKCALENQCYMFQPQFAFQYSCGFVGDASGDQSVPAWAFLEFPNSGLNPGQRLRFIDGDLPASTTL